MCKNTVSDKDRLDCFNYRSQTYRVLYVARINREFRFVVLALTFLFVCFVAKLSTRIPQDGVLFVNQLSWFDFILLVTFALFCILAYKYLKSSAEANNWCQKEAEIAEDVALAYVTEKESKSFIELWEEIKDKKKLSKASHPAKNRWKWQLYVVIGGALLSSIIVIFT